MTTNKKILIFVTVVLFLTISLIIVNQPEKEPHITITRVGYFPTSIWSFPLIVAQEKKFFNEHHLEVQLKSMEGPAVIPALLAENIDYFLFTQTGARGSLQGIPIKTVIILTKSSFMTLITQPNLELNDLTNIAITRWHTPPHYLALRTIKENNISAKIISTETVTGGPAFLMTDKADALIYDLGNALQIKEKYGYPILKIFDDHIPQGLTTSDKKIANNPEEVEKMVEAIQSSLIFIVNNPKESQELLFEFLELERNKPNKKIIEELYSVLKEAIDQKGLPGEKEVNTLIKITKAGAFETINDIEKQEVTEEDITTVFDFRFIK